MKRCEWCGSDPLYMQYHDQEWGVPCHDNTHLFEMLILEGAQAGLSWITILKKREHYRKVFDQFDIDKIARYTPRKINALLNDPGIVRNRLKVESTVTNARACLALLEQEESLSSYLWQFVEGTPIQNKWKSLKDVPASTLQSDQMSKALKQKGFRFTGSTICYAFMQAVGMVNDHVTGCYRHSEIRKIVTKN